ncbi:MAG: cation diffusion facilitator family transporter [Burkholderiaceae bacterium]
MAESKTVVYGAMAGNLAVAVTKFIVAGISGSSAMLSEAIHSTVDTGNSVLLLIGLKRSDQPPDAEHPFGYGKELYFWGLLVAMLIFALGGGMSAYEGVTHILHPEPLEDAKWSYIVLGCAAVFEGISFSIGMHALWQRKGSKTFWQAIRTSKDPGTFNVIAEDGAALAGLARAALGVWSSHYFNMPELDGAASVAIGVLLAGVAVFLVVETRSLLIGEGVNSAISKEIRTLVGADPAVAAAAYPLTMYFGPNNVLLTLDVTFVADISGVEIAKAVQRIENEIRSRYPVIKRIFLETQSIACVGQPGRGRGARAVER